MKGQKAGKTGYERAVISKQTQECKVQMSYEFFWWRKSGAVKEVREWLLNWATRADRSSLWDRQEHVKQHTLKPYALSKLPEKSETGLFLRTPTLQQWSQSRHISKHPKAQETSRKGKWKECNSQVMSRNAAPNCLHDMMWLLHLGAHNSCGFYIKTCTKSSQSMSKQESSGCYTTTSSWGIISSYWQLMVSGEGRANFLQVCGPCWLPTPFLMEGSQLCACRQY